MLGNLLHPTLKRWLKKPATTCTPNTTIPVDKHSTALDVSLYPCRIHLVCTVNYNGHVEQPHRSKIDSIRITAIIFFFVSFVYHRKNLTNQILRIMESDVQCANTNRRRFCCNSLALIKRRWKNTSNILKRYSKPLNGIAAIMRLVVSHKRICRAMSHSNGIHIMWNLMMYFIDLELWFLSIFNFQFSNYLFYIKFLRFKFRF